MPSVRPLSDADLPALEALLGPTEERSTFLLGNARECGVTDRGGRRNGLWLGAFVGSRLEGVVAHARGPNSLVIAPGGHARALLAAAAVRGLAPSVLVGTADRTDEAVAALPPGWRVRRRQRETLFVLRWPSYARPATASVIATPLRASQAAEAGLVLDALEAEASLGATPAYNLERARRLAEEGRAFVTEADGRVVSISSEAATTGRLVHVGATATLPPYRRRGLAGACVAAVLEAARARGRAPDGGVLFTGEDNVPAIGLYERMGFRSACPFELCLLETGA